MGINKSLWALLLISITFQGAWAQYPPTLNGTCKVSESWTVIVYRGANNAQTRFSGQETGTLAISNGTYNLIYRTGNPVLNSYHTAETIYYDGSDYSISSDAYPLMGISSGPNGFYAVIELTFFVIWVPLGSQSDGPTPWAYASSAFTATGTSLTRLSGIGAMVDQNSGPGTPSYYITRVDAFSTAALTSDNKYGLVSRICG